MKRRLFVGMVAWTLAVTVLHIWTNVGFAEMGSAIRASLGIERRTMRVGFLPVT